jgi:hypothetical protein
MILVVRATVGDEVLGGGGGAAGMVMVKLPRKVTAPRVLWVLMVMGRECS